MAIRLIFAGILSLVAFALWASMTPNSTALSTPPQAQDDTVYIVTRVLDGDTIIVNDAYKVRYIGIDTPEFYADAEANECFAAEAKDRNTQLVLGKTVRLEKDTTDLDQYGRLLRYVYLDDPLSSIHESTSINEILVHEGYAYARAYHPDTHLQTTLNELSADAQAQARGLWNTCK